MRILIIEDDQNLSEAMAYALTREGFEVDTALEGDDGLRWIRERAHDLIFLDRMLPRIDGLSILKTMRKEQITTPVLMITALGQLSEVVEGLETGADDYIVKPFHIKELLARTRALTRRPRDWSGAQEIRVGDTSFDPTRKLLTGKKDSCSLSKRESALLEIFLRNPKITLPRSTLFTHVWGPDAPTEEGNLENYIHFLRRRLKSVGSDLTIVTIRGIGYCLEPTHV